jgi:hypothetical protein
MEFYWIGNVDISNHTLYLSYGGSVPIDADMAEALVVVATETQSFLKGRGTPLFITDVTKTHANGIDAESLRHVKNICSKLAGEIIIDECGKSYTGREFLKFLADRPARPRKEINATTVPCPLFGGRHITISHCTKHYVYNLNKHPGDEAKLLGLKCFKCPYRAMFFKGEKDVNKRKHTESRSLKGEAGESN